MLRRVSLSLSVLWDLAEYRGGRTSTVICFFPFSHCALGPYGGMWRRRLTPDSLMALQRSWRQSGRDRGFRPIIPAPTAVIPPSRYGVAFYISTSPSPAILSAAPPLSEPLGPWPSPPFPTAKEVTETKQEGSGGRNWNILITLSVFPFTPIIPAPSAVIPLSR